MILSFFLLTLCLPVGAKAANVVLSPQKLTVNGSPVECEKYNIDGSNYFKLRDIAYLLNGTESQFEVGYDNITRTVTVTSGPAYTPTGSELVIGEDKSDTAVPSSQAVIINGQRVEDISVYNLAGNNFFKLRDLGSALGFSVDYDKASNTAIILSEKTYPASMSAAEIFEKYSSAVFYIETFDIDGYAYASGSGFFIDESGIAVTNNHVLKNALSASATLTDGKKYSIDGVLAFDSEMDYAVIKVNGSGFNKLKLGNSSVISAGETVYAVGSPYGLQNTISDGIVSATSRPDYKGYIQTTTPISSGSSGGALFNGKGEVIGITTSSIVSGQNLNFAVPINYVTELSDLSSADPMDLAQYAEANEYLTYGKIIDDYQNSSYVYENENPYYPDYIDNGTLVFGSITDETTDEFIVHCNTVGRIEAVLYSESPLKYVNDLVMYVDSFNSTAAGGTAADLIINDDGTVSQYLSYTIPKAGVYDISLFSMELFETEKLNTDYTFFYTFIPGQSDTPDTDGSTVYPDNTRQQNAFYALCDFITANYNTTISDFPTYKYDASTDTYLYTFSASYLHDSNSVLVMHDNADDNCYYLVSFSLNDVGHSYLVHFVYYGSVYDDSPLFEGYSTVFAPDYDPNYTFKFDYYYGSSYLLESYEGLAMAAFDSAVDIMDLILKYNVAPSEEYGMADFGFSKYY
ncbi:MAG: trypsin-like peptidase domain-containing protein [Oscillospiraceae bacterium]|nr:trypsin-like peptidase domain-containing protein [Oscillospiraceae bacterium]